MDAGQGAAVVGLRAWGDSLGSPGCAQQAQAPAAHVSGRVHPCHTVRGLTLSLQWLRGEHHSQQPPCLSTPGRFVGRWSRGAQAAQGTAQHPRRQTLAHPFPHPRPRPHARRLRSQAAAPAPGAVQGLSLAPHPHTAPPPKTHNPRPHAPRWKSRAAAPAPGAVQGLSLAPTHTPHPHP